MPRSRYQTLAELARGHVRIGLKTANDVGDVMVGGLLALAGYSLKDLPFTGFFDTAQWVWRRTRCHG